ncbi:MAG: PIG-L family deacetylase, partial [Cyclobacteriaceae bacterium]|nr:PIG-L family deacetylase [Cyclobacteriaceae bacterium]
DFGYSKNPSETLQNWNKETILSDVVWVIRKFQPDIIITRFNTIPGVTHGHHTTSAILAEEAFAISGDPNAFPEQLEYVKPWSAKRIFWNAYNFRGEFEAQEGEVYHEFPTGEYNPVLGQTYNQMAANSRTMHKSQGFGSTAYTGASNDHIQFIAGEKFEQSPFEGVKNRWDHFENGKATELLIKDLVQNFDFRSPANNLSSLLKIREQINQMEGSDLWIQEKKESINDIVLKVIGSKIEFVTNQEVAFPGASVSTDLVINSPGNTSIKILGVEVLGEKVEVEGDGSSANEPFRQDIIMTIPEGFEYTQPYWLENYEDGPMYPVDDQQMIGKPFNDASIQATLNLEIEGQLLTISTPLVYKFNDPVDGEVNQPFIITPSIDLELSKKVLFGINEKRPQVTVFVNFRDKIVDGVLSFAGLDSSEYRILESEDLVGRKQRKYQVEFVSDQVGKRRILATYTTSSGSFDQTLNRITYKHIPNLTFFTSASIDWIQADWEISGGKIGYVPGAGDEVPEVLEALGYEVTMLGDSDFDLDNLAQFKAIIMGIRAYNTNAQAAANQQALMGYVLSGGNMIVQYNTTGRLLTNQLGPYPFSLTRDRVSVETAPVEADYTHPILAGPNKIFPSDFEGWVQERGLYFAGS